MVHTKRIPELDGLRAFAVMLVIGSHLTEFAQLVPAGFLAGTPVVHYVGLVGVHLFFVISGFIITTLLLYEKKNSGKVSLKAFYARRFFRIIPPYAAYLLIIFLVGLTGYYATTPINFLWSILFLTNWGVLGFHVDGAMWLVAHTWSLAVEEQFYLILPPVMVRLLALRLRPINWLVVGLFGLCLFSYKLANDLARRVHPVWIQLMWLYQFRYILVGVLMALHKEAIHRRVVATSGLIPIVLIGFILLVTTFGRLQGGWFLLINTTESFAFGYLLLWIIANPARCGVLRWGWVQWLGSCSYSLYLWQQPFTGGANCYNGWSISQSPLTLVPIFVCAALSYYLIERPTIRLGKRVSARLMGRDQTGAVEIATDSTLPQ